MLYDGSVSDEGPKPHGINTEKSSLPIQSGTEDTLECLKNTYSFTY